MRDPRSCPTGKWSCTLMRRDDRWCIAPRAVHPVSRIIRVAPWPITIAADVYTSDTGAGESRLIDEILWMPEITAGESSLREEASYEMSYETAMSSSRPINYVTRIDRSSLTNVSKSRVCTPA